MTTKDSHVSHKIYVYQKCIVGSYDRIEATKKKSKFWKYVGFT